MSSNSTISITYKFKGDGSGLKDLVKDVERMQQAFRDGVQPAEQLRTSLVNFNQIAQSFEAIGAAVSRLDATVQDLASAYAVQEEAETKLETVMRQRMHATEEEIQGIKDFCSAQQQIGVIGDEVQLSGAQQLATFLTQKAALQELIPAMNNLVAQQKGLNATSGDTVTIANLLGKAMTGQTSALRRVGITFSEAEEKAVKNGNEMERASALARIITNNVGNMNAALAQTDSGKAKQVANAMGDIKEQLGGIVKGIAPYTSVISSLIATAANAGRAAAAMRGLYTATLGANGAFGFISASSVAAAFGMNAAGTAARFLAAGLRMILAAVGVGLVIQGLSLAVDAFTASANKATESAEDLGKAQKQGAQGADAEAASLKQLQAQVAQDTARTKEFTGTKAQEKKLVEELNQRYGETMGYFSSVSAWYKALQANSEAYCRQMTIEAQVRRLANQIADEEEFRYNLTHNADGTEKKMQSGYNGLNVTNTAKAVNDLNTAVAEKSVQKQAALQARMEKLIAEGAAITMKVRGSSTPPAAGTGSGGQHGAAREKELTVLEKIEAQIRANQEAALTADVSQLESLKANTTQLVRERDRLREIQDSLTKAPDYTPPAVEEIRTYEDLDKAMGHYSERLRKAQPEERAEINKTVSMLKALREGWDNALNPPAKEQTPLERYIEQLTKGNEFKSQGSPIASMDLSGLLSGYREIESVLSGIDGDITAGQRESLQKTAGEYARYARKAVSSMATVRAAWSGVKGISGGIDAIKDSLEGSGTAWEKITATVDAAFQIFDGITGIVQVVKNLMSVTQMLTAVTQTQTAATAAGAAAETVAASSKAAAARQATTANIAEAASGFFKANSSIPVVGLVLAAAGIAAMIAMMATLPKFADGGIAYGPTVGLFGEYAGARSNPEVVAPLDRLQGLLGGEAGAGELTCRVKGSDLEFIYNRRRRKKSRM